MILEVFWKIFIKYNLYEEMNSLFIVDSYIPFLYHSTFYLLGVWLVVIELKDK